MRQGIRSKIVGKHWRRAKCCRRKKFAENVYYHELVRSLNRFGYRVQNNPRGDFEIEGVSKELIERFSKRHREIDEKTKELLEREPERPIKTSRRFGPTSRTRNGRGRSRTWHDFKLQSLWNKQLSWGERWRFNRWLQRAIRANCQRHGGTGRAIEWAENHLFERRSVVHEHELWRHALEHARGQNVSLADIQANHASAVTSITQNSHANHHARRFWSVKNIVTLAQHRMQYTNRSRPIIAHQILIG
jgi:hypothetical protein